MKYLILLSLGCLLYVSAKAQKLEINVQAGTGLYNYTGSGTQSSTFLNEVSNSGNAYLNNPYGRKAAFSYEAGLQAKWVTAGGFLFGASAGYQILRSKAEVNRYYRNVVTLAAYSYITAYTGDPVHGNGIFSNSYINLSPYIGYRFKMGRMSLDAMPGVSFGLATHSVDKSKIKFDGADDESYKYSHERTDPKNDFRANLNLALNINRWGLTAGYMHGISDYRGNLLYMPASGTSTGDYKKQDAYSQLFSLGLFYRLK